MSTSSTRKGRRKAWAAVAVLGGALGLFLTLGAGAASAAITCVYNGAAGTLTVTEAPVSGSSDSVTFRKGGGSVGAILVNGSTCVDLAIPAAAAVSNVDTVIIDLLGNGAAGDTVTIDNTNGRVTEPGFTQTELDLNDIEWELSNVESFIYLDTEAQGAVTIGDYGTGVGVTYDGPGVPDNSDNLINLNAFPADNDADVVDLTDSLVAIGVNGNGGDDFILGKGGDGTGAASDVDLVLDGGDGLDEIEGGTGDDWISGGPGKDVLDGNANTVPNPFCVQDDQAGEYDPFISGGDTVDFTGEAGPLTIVFNEDGSLTITVNPDATVVDFENVVGSDGNDTITGNSLNNYIDGGKGNDTLSGGAGDDVLVGGDGDDVLAGDAGDDCEVGNDGNDTFNENTGLGTPASAFGNGADAMDGGPGLDDVVDYGGRTNRTVVNLGVISWFNDGADPNADSISNECDDVFFTTENAITGSGNDMLSANYLNNQSDNEFTAGAGNDQVQGGAGNDILHEGTAANGSDAFEGDAGSDTADYSGRSNALNVALDGTANDGEAGEGDNIGADVLSLGPAGCANVSNNALYDHPAGENEPYWEDEADEPDFLEVENIDAGSGNDVLSGNAQGNVIKGNAGNDTISGGEGSDSLSGGDGNDSLAGNGGNDALDAGAGTDWFDYQSAGAGGVGVQVNLATGAASGEGNDSLTGGENVGGSSFADVLRGDAGANVLNGRGGNDAIQGNAGDDVINGGPGNDELNGNGGNDTVRGQSGNDTVRGAGGDDLVKGDLGNDTVFGGAGDDKVVGGSGKDDLRGGPGTDTCQPGSPGLARGDTASGCEA